MITVDQLKRDFEKIVSEKNAIMLQHRGESEKWQDCYYCHPNSTQAKSLQKRVNALSTEYPTLYALLIPLVDRLLVKQSEIEVAKAAQAKAREDRKNAAATKREEKAANKTNPYRTLHPKVAELMREIAEPYRVKAVEQSKAQQTRFIEQINAEAAKCNTLNPQVLFPLKSTKQSRAVYIANAEHQMMAHKYIVSEGGDWKFKTDFNDIIDSIAKSFANEMVISFVYKVGTKLSGIVERKGNLSKTAITGSLQDHWMTLEFADGSNFQVQSQIVWKCSINGVHFPQFPTCFRNVTMPDGSKMELPSEFKMKEQFV